MESATPQQPHILIVDDEPFLRDIIAIHMGRKGATCAQAEDAIQALDLLQQQSFDAVICDVHMPKLSGPQLVLRVREELGLELPIIMMTGGIVEGWLTRDEKDLRDYIQGTVHKPFTDAELYQAFNSLW